MATSGTTTFANTESDIIESAFRKIGQLGDWETMSTVDTRYIKARRTLNTMLKAWVADGMQLWKISDITIPFSSFSTGAATIGLSGSGASVTVTSQPLKLQKAVRVDTSTTPDTDTELELISYNEYMSFPQKLATGAPTQVAFVPKRLLTEVYVYNTPDSYWTTNGSLKLRCQFPFEDMLATTNDLDFPAYWNEAVIYGLAIRLAPEYGYPQEDRLILKQEAKEAKELAMSYGSEDASFFIQPDRRWRVR